MRRDVVLTAGRYCLLERLGSGGMGEVFRAHDYLTDEIVALKQIRYAPPFLSFSRKPDQEDPAVALVREFRTLATLRHPNVISVLDFGFVSSDRPYYTMSLVENARDLGVVAQKSDFSGKVALLIEVLQALIYLHRRGILHRDLKPGNVLVDAAGQVRVLDFGLSVEQELAQGFVGTLAYMAPEILEKEQASVASDLYSVGVMAYEFLAGRHPYDVKRMHMLVREIISNSPNFDILPTTPALRGVIECLLAKDPADRYPDAESALAALCQAADMPLPAESIVVRESFLQNAKFIGRKHEYDLLTTALLQAKQGNGSGWLVTGEFGVGKSRLVDEIRIQALVQGFRVLRAQMDEAHSGLLQALCDALLPLLLVTSLTSSESEVLKPLIPTLDRLIGDTVPVLPSAPRQAAVFQVIMAILARQTEPVLLIIEDLHWSVDDISLLRQLYDFARRHMLLVIGTYANDQAPYLYGKFDWQTNLIELRRFNRAEIESLAVSMLGQAACNEQVFDFIEHQSEGNVFFMIDLIHSLMEDADRLQDIGRVTLPRKLLSQGLLESSRQRLARVPLDYHPMLRFAAVLGRELDFKLLKYVDDELYYPHWLAVCSDAAVLEVVENKWRFAHDKIRDALLLDIDLRRLLELHQLAAEAIEAVYPDKPEYAPALANHWYVAGVLEKEEYYTRLAGIHLLHKGNLARAETYLRRAKALSVQQDPLVFESLVSVLKHRGKLDQALAIAEELLALSAQHPEWRLRAIVTYFSVVAEAGVSAATVDVPLLLQEGLQHAQSTPRRDEATCMYKAAAHWVVQSDTEKASEFYRQALRQEKHPHRIAGLYHDMGVLAIRTGDWSEAAFKLRLAAQQYAALGDIFSQSNVLSSLSLVLLHQKAYTQVFEVAQSGLRLAEESGAAVYLADNAALLGLVCLCLHQVQESRRYFVQALRTLLAIEHISHQVMLLLLLAYWYWYHQDMLQAARLLLVAKDRASMLDFAYHTILGELEAGLKQQFSVETWEQLVQEQRDDVTAVLRRVLHEFA